MPNIQVVSTDKLDKNSLNGIVIFYRCHPCDLPSNTQSIDITNAVFHYISENMEKFKGYIKNYISKNGSDARINLSRLFEFHTTNTYANSALELIGIIKTVSTLKNKKITLIVSDEYKIELLQTAFNPGCVFKFKKIWYLKRILHIFSYVLFFLPAVKLKGFLQGKHSQAAEVLFHSFVIGDRSSGCRVDPYFSDLIQGLKQHGMSVHRLVSFLSLNPVNSVKLLWKLDAKEFIFPESTLSLIEIWKSIRLSYFIKEKHGLGTFIFDGCDLTAYLKTLSLYMSFHPVNFRFDLMRKYVRERGNQYKALIIQNENYFYQRCLFQAARQSTGNIRCIAYQFGQMNYFNPNHHYIFSQEYQPDIFFASGKYYTNYMVKRLGYPKQQVKEAFSLQIPCGRKYRRSEVPIICIYVSDIFTEAVCIMNYAKKHLTPYKEKFKIGIRFHPYCTEKIIKLYDFVDYFEYLDANDSLFRSDSFLSAGSSTIIFSAAMTGKPVYLLDSPYMPRWFESHFLDNIKYIKDDYTIKANFAYDEVYIDEDNGISSDETCDEIKRLLI